MGAGGFGAGLRALRVRSGLSQAEVGLRIGRTQQLISHIETGREVPSLRTFALLCSLYGCAAGGLLRVLLCEASDA